MLSHVLVVLDSVLVHGLLPLLLVAEVRLVSTLAVRLAVLIRHRTIALLLLRLLRSRHIISIHLLLLLERTPILMVVRSIHTSCSLVCMSIGHLLLIDFRSAVVNFTAPWFDCTFVCITGRDIHICLRFDNVENLIISCVIGRPLIIRIFTYSINSLRFQILHTSAIFNTQAGVVILQLREQLLELFGILSMDYIDSRIVTVRMISRESLHA